MIPWRTQSPRSEGIGTHILFEINLNLFERSSIIQRITLGSRWQRRIKKTSGAAAMTV